MTGSFSVRVTNAASLWRLAQRCKAARPVAALARLEFWTKALRSVIFNRREYGAVAPRDVDFFYTWLLAVSKNRLVNMTTRQYRVVYKKLLI